jgi:hypothetical protein
MKKPMSNFVNPRIKLGDRVPAGTASSFAAAADDDDATVSVSFDAALGAVSLDANSSAVSVTKTKATIGFSLSVSNLPSGASAQIVGVEFSKPNEPAGTFDASNVFEDRSSFTDGSGTSHTVYGSWKQNKSKLKVIDDDNVPAGGAEEDYGYKVWVKVTSSSGTASYYASPDPEVKNKPTG